MKKKRVLIVCPYPKDKAPSQRLKYEQYIPHFESEGFEIAIKPFMSNEFWDIVYKNGNTLKKIAHTCRAYFCRIATLFSLANYDIVYVHLWVTPFGLPIFEFLYRVISKKIIYDIDDMIFLGHSSNANKFIETLKGKDKMIYLMKQADHIITCTPTLDEFVRQYNKKTTDISSTINTENYVPKQDYSQKKTTTLGWSGSHSTSKYLLLLEPVFEALLKTDLSFQILVIGDPSFRFKNENIPTKAISWKHDREVFDLSKIDIGLYPLPNEKWVLGKSGLKALQYMALGIPTIATKIGANSRIISQGINGFLVEPENIDDWTDTIKSLMVNAELQATIGRAGHQTVLSTYSINANKSTYLEIMKKV